MTDCGTVGDIEGLAAGFYVLMHFKPLLYCRLVVAVKTCKYSEISRINVSPSNNINR